MTKAEKLDLIERFETGYTLVETQIKGLSAAELRFVPRIADAWSINDFLVHFLDADLSMAFRVRAALAQPGFAVPVWDEEAWQARLRYDDEDGPSCLKEAEALRSRLAATLRRFADEDWSAYYVEHPSRGRLDLKALLGVYRDHIAFHVPLIRRNLDALRAPGRE
jgi:catechol 2,3-dioxygenase-like lactoylglutathione lyase family enzyme